LIEADRFGELLDAIVGFAGESAAPGFLCGHGGSSVLQVPAMSPAAQAASAGDKDGIGLPP
jgi:hypothetical protein